MKKLLFSALILALLVNLIPLASQAYTDVPSNALKPGMLIKSKVNSVYYYGSDAKRYVFPNEKTYKTWYSDFNSVVGVGDELLSDIPLGGNVTYKPGKRLIKVQSDSKVYYVSQYGTLRHITSAAIAQSLYGNNWRYMVDDVPDSFFVNYKMGEPLYSASVPYVDYNYSINQDKYLTTYPDANSWQLGSLQLTGELVDNTTVRLYWTVNNFYASKGYKVVMASHKDPVYPGDDYHYLSDPNTLNDQWNDLYYPTTYYFRVCEYLGNACGVYSNNFAVKVPGNSSLINNNNNNNSGKYISLSVSTSGNNAAYLSWNTNFESPYGFKAVISDQANPVYPGNDYHYLSTANSRSDTWTGLNYGQTYHFRVCEYLNGYCGVYSNDAYVTIGGSDNTYTNGSIYLSGWFNQTDSKVYLEWSVGNLATPYGFKIVRSTASNPVYPGDDYHYLTDPTVRSDKWSGLSNGTYHFRVCKYNGGSCDAYSNDLTVTVTNQNNSTGYITLAGSYDSSTNKVNLNWAVTNIYSSQGYKVVRSTSSNPVYPGDDYHYLSSADARADTWTGLSNATYHFRVCQYSDGVCLKYSNDLSITVSNQNDSNGSITLSGYYDSSVNKVYLNWTVSSLYSSQGYKVVRSTSSYPVYPGDDYHYLSSADARTDNWASLAAGTQHFRVCKYVDGSCTVYSNDLSVSIP